MKTLKYFLSVILIVAAVWSCNEDEFGSADFVSTAIAPTNLTALFNVTQDNTGVVTITPNSEGAVSYDVHFGDSSTEPVKLKQGESTTHTYAEGNYDVKIIGQGITGLKTEATVPLVVSFKAPENLLVEISNDQAISKQVNVTATADFATSFDVYFGEEGTDDPIAGNIGETVSYVYTEPGTYTITVVAKGAAIATSEYTVDFESIAIVQPINAAPAPPFRNAIDVISLYGSSYANLEGTNFNPDWGQSGQGSGFAEFDFNGDAMLQYINLSYQGIALAEGTSIDVSAMEYLHLDVWTPDVAKIETSLISLSNGEKPVWSDLTPDEWTSIDIPITAFTEQGLTVADIFQLKLVGDPWAGSTVFIDNIYFWKAPAPSSGLEGNWKLAPVAGALKVGPSPGNGDWWTSDAQAVIDRACYFDDVYVFGTNGSFKNELGGDTWLEGWQGTADACGAPVAPHDGSASATFVYNETAGKLTINGTGAYLGLPKANNAGELPNVEVPSSITYDVTLTNNGNSMTVGIETGSGVFWTYELVRDGAVTPSPVAGTWTLANEAGALKVGPSADNGDWWTSDAQAVVDRACYFDDLYIFSDDGSFSNDLGADTWLEAWQGTADACGAPVAPHDGSANATFVYDEAAGTITLNGTGAYLGLPKANNEGELPNVAVPTSITYNIELSDNASTMKLIIESGAGVFWTFKLVRAGSTPPPPPPQSGDGPNSPIDFESNGHGVNWTWSVFENDSNPAVEIVANPDASGINTSANVAKITALQAGQPWVGFESQHGTDIGSFTFDATNSIVKIMVWKSVISDVGLKFAEANGEAQPEVKVANTKVNEWEELTFDLSGSIGAGITGIIDQIIIFPDFDLAGRTGDNVVYIDNVTFGSN